MRFKQTWQKRVGEVLMDNREAELSCLRKEGVGLEGEKLTVLMREKKMETGKSPGLDRNAVEAF